MVGSVGELADCTIKTQIDIFSQSCTLQAHRLSRRQPLSSGSFNDRGQENSEFPLLTSGFSAALLLSQLVDFPLLHASCALFVNVDPKRVRQH